MRLSFLSSLLITVLFLLSSCGEVEVAPRYVTLNGDQYNVAIALLEDYGTDYNITYRSYKLSFRDREIDPSNYLNFMIYSNSTTRIQEGVYEYSYAVQKGYISYIEIGTGLVYDSQGYAISGLRLTESNSTFEGTVTISKPGDDYDFTFNLTALNDNHSYVIQGRYNAVLTEGYIY